MGENSETLHPDCPRIRFLHPKAILGLSSWLMSRAAFPTGAFCKHETLYKQGYIAKIMYVYYVLCTTAGSLMAIVVLRRNLPVMIILKMLHELMCTVDETRVCNLSITMWESYLQNAVVNRAWPTVAFNTAAFTTSFPTWQGGYTQIIKPKVVVNRGSVSP